MRGPACLQPDAGRRQLAEELLHLAAAHLPAQHRLLVLVDSMNLKDMLGGIQANPDNRHWAAPLAAVATSQPGTFDAVGGRPPQHIPEASGISVPGLPRSLSSGRAKRGPGAASRNDDCVNSPDVSAYGPPP